MIGTSGTTHRPLQLPVKVEEVTRVAGPDLSATAQDFVHGVASSNIRASTPTFSGGDASVVIAGTAGPVPTRGSTVLIHDQSQQPPPHSQTESSSSVQTRPPSVQVQPSGHSAQAPFNVPVQPPSTAPTPPPSSGQTQPPPGDQVDSTPINQVPSPPGNQVDNSSNNQVPSTPGNQMQPPVNNHVQPPPGTQVPPPSSSQVPTVATGATQATRAGG